MFQTSVGTCLDLFLTNERKSFQNTGVRETDVSNQHLLKFSFLKITFTKMPPNKLRYRKYKLFDKTMFSKDISNLPEKKQITHNGKISFSGC